MIGQFNIAPSEYWRMTPAEVASILDANRPKEINGIHEDDYENIMIRRQKLIDEGINVI